MGLFGAGGVGGGAMKLYMAALIVVGTMVGCAWLETGEVVTWADCKRWEAGRAVPADVAAACERAWRKRFGVG